MPAHKPVIDFASLITQPVTQRWPNLESYGIELKIAVYKDGSESIYAAGGQPHAEKLQQLGFVQIDDEWTLPVAQLLPREILRLFPDMVMEKEMQASNIFVDRTHLSQPDSQAGQARSALHERLRSRIKAVAQPDDPFLNGQPDYEKAVHLPNGKSTEDRLAILRDSIAPATETNEEVTLKM